MTQQLIHIDGSQGEGGGQILRSSLALSMVTGRAFRISRIRAGRAKPGLLRQHLTCVHAAAAICSADVAGAALGSQEITFVPGAIRGGSHRFSIGSAGGTMLVIQAILPALLRASECSTITIEGGTHNKAAPPFEFVVQAMLPVLQEAGAQVELRLERHGFYPAGGGRVVLEVQPTDGARSVERLQRGARVSASATGLVSQLSRKIAERELEVLRVRLGLTEEETRVVSVPDPVGPGNALSVQLQFEHITEVFSACGEVGKSAEVVARELSDEVRAYIAEGKPIGPHLADQLMVPLAVLAGGRFATGELSAHASTNMDVIRAFGGTVELMSEGVVRVEAMS